MLEDFILLFNWGFFIGNYCLLKSFLNYIGSEPINTFESILAKLLWILWLLLSADFELEIPSLWLVATE